MIYNRLVYFTGGIDRDMQFFSQIAHRFDMVIVVVCDQDCHDRREVDPIVGKPLLDDTRTDAGVDQDAVTGIPQIVAVATTTAAQAEKRESFRWKKFILHTY